MNSLPVATTVITTVVCAYLTRDEWYIAAIICTLGLIVVGLLRASRYGSEGG